MSRPRDAGPLLLTTAETARFTSMVALLAIFSDAALGHGLTWENDPYWTYWVTKTFLIATIFGLGTAWFGIGLGRGAVITAVHTIVLTIYYWTFSPVGLPSSPEWLDFEHTWITGVPIHFAVIFLGYVAALWLWLRRPVALAEDVESRSTGLAALVVGLVIVLAAGLVAALAVGTFPGVTWFPVRLLLTIPFLLWWWAWAGRDPVAALVGAVVLALVWATYGHFLGPAGLPDTPLRIFETSPPPATVEFLDYRQLWLISLPIYLVVMGIVLLIDSVRFGPARWRWRPAAAAAALPAVLLLVAAGGEGLGREGASATLRASGPVQTTSGDQAGGGGSADIRVTAEDMGGRVTPLPPHDRLTIKASIESPDGTIGVTVRRAMVEHPLGEHTTWRGVGLDVEHHGNSGIGTSSLPPITSELAAFGVGEVSLDGDVVAGVPVHLMTAESGLPGGARLGLELGPEGFPEASGLPGGRLSVFWEEYSADIEQPSTWRYVLGGFVTLVMLLGAVWLTRREQRRSERSGKVQPSAASRAGA
jgi:hypothetical protein